MTPAISSPREHILTVNGGSSSIKFALYDRASLQRGLHGKMDRIGVPGTKLTVVSEHATQTVNCDARVCDYATAAHFMIDWLQYQPDFESLAAVGHRVVHGMRHSAPELVKQELLDELHRIQPYDPEHLPGEIMLIELLQQRYPRIPQVACFDTAFHSKLPRVARLLPIPRRLEEKGVQRYGFHGLSYAYLMTELERLGDPAARSGRIVLAHLGNGASMAAVRDGQSVDTSMAFTPTSGLPMSTRSGDLDPGLVGFLANTEDMTARQFAQMVSLDSGLLGISGSSSDIQDLLERERTDAHAADAVKVFCYQAKKWIGAFAAVLGGIDTLVFAGGIGENSPVIRARICAGLRFLGIELDGPRNASNAAVISQDGRGVTVRVIRTDEEIMLARAVVDVLRHG
ncbi:MAG: acetate/propionate family kinase [Steroidobacteraceae bacterium]